MSADRFRSPRPDGRSNAQVVIDLVAPAELGTTFAYDELGTKLAEGTDRTYSRAQIGGAIRSANRRLHRHHKRHLRSVTNVGYRLALPEEHTGLATIQEGKAVRHIGQAVSILTGVDWNAMDPNTRAATHAHLQITGAIFQQVSRLGRKQREMARALDLVRSAHADEIAQIKQRLDRVEQAGVT